MFHLSKKSNTKPTKKQQISKKVQKTIFQDPFHYKIQLLPSHQDQQVQNLLLIYLKQLRQQQPFKSVCKAPEKFISFNKKQIKQKLSTLVNKQKFIIGIKTVRSYLLNFINSQKKQIDKIPQIILIFYEEKKHQLVQSLLCLIKNLSIPFLLVRQSKKINDEMGIKNLSVMCLFQEKFAFKLYKYVGKCLIDIPQVVLSAFSIIKEIQK